MIRIEVGPRLISVRSSSMARKPAIMKVMITGSTREVHQASF